MGYFSVQSIIHIKYSIFIGYWLDMEIYVRVLVRSNIARRQEQKLKFKTKVKQVLPLPFRRLSRNINVYSKEFHSYILEHLHIFICIIYILIEVLILNARR